MTQRLALAFCLVATLTAPRLGNASRANPVWRPDCNAAMLASLVQWENLFAANRAIDNPVKIAESMSKLPSIRPSDLEGRSPFATHVKGQTATNEVANYRGRKVHIKNLNRENPLYSKLGLGQDHVHTYLGQLEAHWLLKLNELGLATKLIGMMSESDSVSLVTEFVEGETWTAHDAPPDSLESRSIRAVALRELEKTISILSANGIEAIDLQFMVQPDGRLVIIDPAFFAIGPISEIVELNKERADALLEVTR